MRIPVCALLAATTLGAATLVGACERAPIGQATQSGTLVVSHDTIGDTIVVRNIRGSLWGDSVTLVEDQRFSDGGASPPLSGTAELVVRGDGVTFLYDRDMKSLRVYDRNGQFIRVIGREGSGPGEYREITAMALLGDDLLLRDQGNGRILRLNERGEPVSTWRLASSEWRLQTDTSGVVYARIFTSESATGGVGDWSTATLRMDSSGRVLDTVPDPTWTGGRPARTWFDPTIVSSRHPWGGVVVGHSDRYLFEWRRPDGSVLRIERVDASRERVPEAQRRELNDVIADRERNRTPGSPPMAQVGATKPFFREFLITDDGRIWVSRQGPSIPSGNPFDTTVSPLRRAPQWTERLSFDVFGSDGQYLGHIVPPADATVRYHRGDHVWGTTDENDHPGVVRWRILVPRQGMR